MPTVDFERSLGVRSSPDQVWETITDPGTVAGWVDLVGGVEEIEHLSRYSATLTDRLGPFRLSADLDIRVTELQAPSRVTFVADGEDRQVSSRIKLEATLTVSSAENGSDLHVEGSYEVTGRVATLGASMIRTKGEAVLDDFFNSLSSELG